MARWPHTPITAFDCAYRDKYARWSLQVQMHSHMHTLIAHAVTGARRDCALLTAVLPRQPPACYMT